MTIHQTSDLLCILIWHQFLIPSLHHLNIQASLELTHFTFMHFYFFSLAIVHLFHRFLLSPTYPITFCSCLLILLSFDFSFPSFAFIHIFIALFFLQLGSRAAYTTVIPPPNNLKTKPSSKQPPSEIGQDERQGDWPKIIQKAYAVE